MNDSFRLVVSEDSIVPKYKQIVNAIVNGVKSGKYAPGIQIPSLNEMTAISGASKETVYKAYSYMSKAGVIESHHGKGYFIKGDFLNKEKTVLAILPEASPNMMIILRSFWETLGSYAKVTTVFHNQDPELLKRYIDYEYGKYDFYLIFPHFPLDKVPQGEVLGIIRRAPSGKTIIMDRYLPNIGEGYGMVYQYIYSDIFNFLETSREEFDRFRTVKSVPVYTSLYGQEIEDALDAFCRRCHMPFVMESDVPGTIGKGDVLFLYGCSLGNALVKLSDKVMASGLEIGRDIGIICYDDFQVNEIIMGGLTTLTTDYAEMGKEAAKMILWNQLGKIHCSSHIIRRNSF